MDFRTFKSLLKTEINNWDHKVILYKEDTLCDVLKEYGSTRAGLIIFEKQPTAENMAHFLAEQAAHNYKKYVSPFELRDWEAATLDSLSTKRDCVFTVTVYETPTNAVTATSED